MTPSLTQNHDPNCIFCKIALGQIPSTKVYEDDDLLAIHDINPAAPVHLLIIPKHHVESLAHCTASDALLLGKMLLLAPKLAVEQGCRESVESREGGFRVVINSGQDGGQEVWHLHMHVMGGKRPWKRG
jgi:histidine triad (HIT) family protein